MFYFCSILCYYVYMYCLYFDVIVIDKGLVMMIMMEEEDDDPDKWINSAGRYLSPWLIY